MSFSDNLKKNLNPGLLSDPCHVTLFVALKMLFEAQNYSSLDTNDKWTILAQLTKASRYEEEPDVFLSKKARELSRSDKLVVFHELFELAKHKLVAIAENNNSSFYCSTCIGRK